MTSTPPSGDRISTSAAGNRAAARTLAVLDVFLDGAPSHGVTEVGRRLAMSKSTAFRALNTLADHGILVRDQTGQEYQLGFRLLELGHGPPPTGRSIQSVCAAAMREMHQLTGETITLSIPVARATVTIDGIQGRGRIARRVPLGRMTPLHVSPASRAILAFFSDQEIAQYLAHGPLEQFTATTLTTADAIWSEVRRVRQAGHASGFHDHVPNAMGVGFPVMNHDGRPVASLTVSGPETRLTAGRLHDLLPGLQRVTAELNHRSRLYLQSNETRNDLNPYVEK